MISHQHEPTDLHVGLVLPFQEHGHKDSQIVVAIKDEALVGCTLDDVVRDARYDGSSWPCHYHSIYAVRKFRLETAVFREIWQVWFAALDIAGRYTEIRDRGGRHLFMGGLC